MTKEVATVLPIPNAISRSEWSLMDDSQWFKPSFGYAPSQRVRYGTARWAAKIIYESLSQADRHLLARFVAHVGRHRAFWVYDPSICLRGSFPTSELITSPEAAATWTASTNRAVTAESGGVRNTRTGATTDGSIALTNAVTVVANATYALRAVPEAGGGSSLSAGLSAGSTQTGITYGTYVRETPVGRRTLRCLPTLTSMYVALLDTISLDANYTQQGSILWRNVSLARAFMVDGGSGSLTQTGSAIYVKGLTTSTAGLLKAGDMVEIVSSTFSQMVRVTEDVNSDSGGLSFMSFEPQLRTGVVANDLIIPLKPMVKMILTSDPSIDTRPGWYSDVTLECEECFE